MDFNSSLQTIKGVGEKKEQLLQKLGVCTVGDILLHFPRTYQEYPSITEDLSASVGEVVAIKGCLRTPAVSRRGQRMDVTLATFFSGTIPISVIWFRMPYLAKQLQVGEEYILYGTLLKEKNMLKLEQPVISNKEDYEKLRHCLQPIYPLSKGINQQMLRKTISMALEDVCWDNTEVLPPEVIAREQFPSYQKAMNQIHFPSSFEELTEGRRRIVYQEFFYFILNMHLQKKNVSDMENPWKIKGSNASETLIQKLPYRLTTGQQETLEHIREDLMGAYVSQRLIQGDVGSGKTIVAFLAMLDVVASGYQAAIMAPTEVLARQHAASFRQFCLEYQLPYEVVCLTGSMKTAERRQAYEKISTDSSLFIVGTHALIQEKVIYKDLALVVTDEQHRFGVKQRELFSRKGTCPHMLVMSATPIPRTLAMILYGNMQISAIKELPANRLPIKTCVIKEDMRRKAYEMIGRELQNGHQAYIICPLVEASEQTEAENVTDYTKRICSFFGKDVAVQALHGKMPSSEKNQIMESFLEGVIQILVSTTVVEVGVNVPNATVIMIENANRFGLAQLHQLRGRVGRGKWQSYCILMDSEKKTKQNKRLEVMHQSNDGFFIAKEDLRLRGPGDFFGIRQSGELGFRLADVIQDADLLMMASKDVEELLKTDPSLADHPVIAEKISRYATENNMIL